MWYNACHKLRLGRGFFIIGGVIDTLWLKLAEDWPQFTLLGLILVKLFQSQLVSFLPVALKQHFDTREKLKIDQQEHEQVRQLAEMNLLKLREISQLSSLMITEEQLTQQIIKRHYRSVGPVKGDDDIGG